jgi:hypothetical protein
MALSSKSLAKSPVSEKKIKGSRKVDVKVKVAPLEEVKEEIKEDPVLEIPFEAGANGQAPPLESVLEEVECPPCEEEVEESIEPITLAKKCAKVRPQVNENGDFLNPLTNRYVKFGSSNFKKLLRDGVIKPIELTGL